MLLRSVSMLSMLSLITVAMAAEIEPPLRVENTWLREAPPVAPVMAAYGRFCNDNREAITIAALRSDAFERIEMHETVETETTASMRRLNNVVIGPNDCVDFMPGGRHFMLFEPQQPVRAGDMVALTLVFARGDEQTIEVPVRRQADVEQNNDEQHSHEH